MEKEPFVDSAPQNGAVRTEEGEKSTTYVIAAAQDSTVKVTVQQNKYETSLPATTVRPIGPTRKILRNIFKLKFFSGLKNFR